MKLSFSSLACPSWDVDQIVAAAKKYGFAGIDFRHCRGTTDLHTLPEFTTGLADTARKVAAAGIKVSGISSGLKLFDPDAAKREQYVKDAAIYARIAAGLGARVLRVFGGALGGVPRPEALKMAAASLRAMADVAGREGVIVALETHDDWLRGAEAAAVLDAAGNSPATGVLWDMLLSWHNGNEPAETTWRQIQKRLVATHWKDSDSQPPAAIHYCLPGQGVAPFRKFYELIHGGGYDGYYTFEWEKAWHPELAEADVALPAFVKTMRAIEAGK